MNPHDLPVYRHRDRILQALEKHQVIVVESPTGSGKTTQLPIILHEAGYDKSGMIGVTQPRRIAAVSVSAFIQLQLDKTEPGIVGYKMRFNDQTTRSTKIKIMTDGILLQEMKLDPLLSAYTVLMVDEAHERSLNIDFILGLLKRVLEARPDFKVIVSSATINAEVFSEYFNSCPVVRIETETHPVTTIYKPLESDNDDMLIDSITGVIEHIVDEKRPGDILVFLPGEKLIKQLMNSLMGESYRKKLHVLPLYGRLNKEEQDMVFPPPPRGKIKVIVSTNIAETSVTIDGVTSVIDSGLAKINFYNPKTFTSSLVERPISKASANQRKGRAGRTQPGTCYRMYSKEDFEMRPLFTQEEIYRTDLSEVVLRMAELGIHDFDSFDFISSPGKQGIAGAVETLRLLDALAPDNGLSKIGSMMVAFPLIPRHSRILVEAIMRYPEVMEEALIGTAFLSTDSPFLLPQGEEIEARKAHHAFRDPSGDFVSYLRLYRAYAASDKKSEFCKRYYMDEQTLNELVNVKEQLEQIVGSLGVPIGSGGPLHQYLCAIAKGLIQFVCIGNQRGSYRSLTAEKIEIHPSSVMFRETPKYIVAGEIVRTTKTYARSVSALKKEWLSEISQELAASLHRDDERARSSDDEFAASGNRSQRRSQERGGARTGKSKAGKIANADFSGLQLVKPGAASGDRQIAKPGNKSNGTGELPFDSTWQVAIGGKVFQLEKHKGKKKVLRLSWEDVSFLLASPASKALSQQHANLRAEIQLVSGPVRGILLEGEKLSRVLAIAKVIGTPEKKTPSLSKAKLSVWDSLQNLMNQLDLILEISPVKKDKELGFVTLYTNAEGMFWFKPTRGFSTALSESIASLEYLADTFDAAQHPKEAQSIGKQYRRLSKILDEV